MERRRSLKLPAADGFPLACTLFEPAASMSSQQRPAVVIASATAVPQSFYHRFARHMSEQGCAVITFDYRGIGESMPAPPSDGRHPLTTMSHIRITDWAVDTDVVVDFMHHTYPDRDLVYIGSSVGGHVLPLLQRKSDITRVLLVGVPNVYWRTSRIGCQTLVLYQLLAPLLCPIFGYFPGHRFGIFADMPTAAMMQSGRWTLYANHLCSEPELNRRYAERFPQRVLSISFYDDVWCGRKAIEGYLKLWRGAKELYWHHFGRGEVDELSQGRGIGHLGFFTTPNAWVRMSPYIFGGETAYIENLPWLQGRL